MAGIFMDSGAFSAFTRKTEVNLEEYIAFLQEYKDMILLLQRGFVVLNVLAEKALPTTPVSWKTKLKI